MPESQFKLIAPYYDALMSGMPYSLWVDYVEELLARFDAHPKSVLDVACGTGNVAEVFARRGYEVVGIDSSPDMIEVARKKRGGVSYYVYDIAELDLGRKFDLAVSLFDSLNYVTDPEHLARGMRKVAEHLVDGGLFIFDVNTIYALSHHYFDQASLAMDRSPRYVWRSDYDPRTRLCTVSMTFEVEENGTTRQFKEVHRQRGYTLQELTRMLIDASFEVLSVFHAYKFSKPTRRSDRVFFVGRRLPDA